MNEYDAIAFCVAILGCVLLVVGASKSWRALYLRVGGIVIGGCCLCGGLSYFVEKSHAAALPIFASEGEFLGVQKQAGYLLIGKFDTNWPATYVDELTGEDEISFVRRDGTPHQYRGYDGYQLKVVRLRDAAGGEPMIVLRSRFK